MITLVQILLYYYLLLYLYFHSPPLQVPGKDQVGINQLDPLAAACTGLQLFAWEGTQLTRLPKKTLPPVVQGYHNDRNEPAVGLIKL